MPWVLPWPEQQLKLQFWPIRGKRSIEHQRRRDLPRIPHAFSSTQAIDAGREALRKRAIKLGADMDDLEMEVTEFQEFNMIRDFCTTGKNIRAGIQIKPGLISTNHFR